MVDKFRHAKVALDHDLPIIDERTGLDDYLQTWLEEVVRPALSRATLQAYEVDVREHIVHGSGPATDVIEPRCRRSRPDGRA